MNEVYWIYERASGECEVFDDEVINKGKQALFCSRTKLYLFFVVKYLLKMYETASLILLSIPSSRNFIDENRLRASYYGRCDCKDFTNAAVKMS